MNINQCTTTSVMCNRGWRCMRWRRSQESFLEEVFFYFGSDFKKGKKHVSREMLPGPLSEVGTSESCPVVWFSCLQERKRFSLVPLLTICPLRPKLSLPFPILTNSEHQVFQPIWQRVFPFWTWAGDIKCLLHVLTDVLLHSSHAPMTSLGKGSSPPSCPQGEAQTRSGHCPRMSPRGLNLEFSMLSISYRCLILVQELKTSEG